jgi:putative radical SAM enzyme (TIGR03279 family)
MLQIDSIYPESIAAELGVAGGDYLVSINGEEVDDVVDYLRLTADGHQLFVVIETASSEVWELDIEYEADQMLGFEFSHPAPRACSNNCQFCFVRQLPSGMRDTLYVRDDDYRFSYLYGAYISLTNLQRQDVERIKAQKLSPLYISVHSTVANVRAQLLGRRSAADAAVLPLVQELALAGIEMHTQVVLCPGINDGPILEQTISDLFDLYPAVASLAIVPVGLTRYREGLPELRMVGQEQANELLEQVERWQQHCLERAGTRFVFAADELYLTAQRTFPSHAAYENFCQIENGIGLIAEFENQGDEVLAEVEAEFCAGVRATLVCGYSARHSLEAFVRKFNHKAQTQLQVHAVRNKFWGERVTVSGLLTGNDILASLNDARARGFEPGQAILLPEVMFKEHTEILLDDMDRHTLEQSLGIGVIKIASDPWAVLVVVE